MKKFILGILVLILGFGWVWFANAQEKQSKFKLISAEELAKELRNPNSERLKGWGYLVEFDRAMGFLEGLVSDAKTGSKIVKEIGQDPELVSYLDKSVVLLDPEILFDQSFEFKQFEKGFSELQRVTNKFFTVIQKNLDPSNEEHQKALEKITNFLQKINNPDLLIGQSLPQYRVEFLQFTHAFQFIQAWLIKSEDSISFDNKEALEPLFVEVFIAMKAVQKYLGNETIDKNSEEFQKTFAEYLKTVKEKLDKLINFIETLPEN